MKLMNASTAMLTASVLAALLPQLAQANTPVVGVSQTVVVPASSATLVEQHTDGSQTITAVTPTGFTIADATPKPTVIAASNVPVAAVATAVPAVSTTVPTSTGPVTVLSPVTPTPVITMPTVATPVPVAVGTIVTKPVTESPAVIAVANANSANGIAPTKITAVVTSSGLAGFQITPSFSTSGLVKADTVIKKVMKDAAGNEFLVPANRLNAGDIIEYQTTYTNISNKPITELVASLDLPAGVQLISVQSPLEMLGMATGGSYQVITQAGNTTIVQSTPVIALNTYRSLQWNLINLAPNASTTVMMRAKVL